MGAEVAWQKGFATVPNRILKGHVECQDLTSETFNQRGFRAVLFAGFLPVFLLLLLILLPLLLLILPKPEQEQD